MQPQRPWSRTRRRSRSCSRNRPTSPSRDSVMVAPGRAGHPERHERRDCGLPAGQRSGPPQPGPAARHGAGLSSVRLRRGEPDSFRLCGMCGSTLAESAAFRESRKTVTIVFADPKPATLVAARPDRRGVARRHVPLLRRHAGGPERHGGTVEKFIGDAVMAVFGLPVRHEDDALRAIRAAAAMQAALAALNEDFRATLGRRARQPHRRQQRRGDRRRRESRPAAGHRRRGQHRRPP